MKTDKAYFLNETQKHTCNEAFVSRQDNGSDLTQDQVPTISHKKKASPPRCPSISEWINKLWHNNTVGYHLAIKRNELSSREKACRKFECVFLSERKPI